MEKLPLVSIVTPCYDAARYVEETVRSVLSQSYPRIEYVVMDGGSTDGTLDILHQFEEKIQIFSEKDAGTADAVNKGFARSAGSILAFLNADDYYFPEAISTAVRHLSHHPDAAVVYGEAVWVDEAGEELGRYPTLPYDPERLAYACNICQPATFIRREAMEAVGGLDTGLRYTFDYDLWIRLSRHYRFQQIGEQLAASRMHTDTKTLGSRREVLLENIELLKRHFGYVPFQWVHGYCSYLLDGRDQFFDPLRPSFLKYLAALPAGLYINRRRMGKYLREWRSVMSKDALRRRLNDSLGHHSLPDDAQRSASQAKNKPSGRTSSQ